MSRKEQDSGGKSVYRHTIKYLGLFGGAHGLSILLNMLRTKISSKLLGVAGMSIIALFNRTVQMFSDGTGLSIAFSAVRKISEVYENYRGWCSENGCYPENSRNFNQALRSFATVVRKRPKRGGGATTMLLGYRVRATEFLSA